MSAVEQDPLSVPEQQSSVQIEETAKGTRVRTKVYDPDIEVAREKACRAHAGTVAWLEAHGLRGPA